MKIGAVFPQIEIGPDPAAVREYALTAEDLGYSHLITYDHVIGADVTTRPGWRGPYNVHDLFHEPFVLFGYLAGITQRLEFVTGILILPQRQTVLVAKQAAEVDVLSGGRFRLGVGLGWNDVEYQALGENFRNRGKRSEEQIELLRRLFTEEVVTFHGRWHEVEAAGIKPLPARPIPIWIGGASDVTLQRVARSGDGWFPQMPPNDTARAMVEALHRYTRDAGRDPASIGLEGRLTIAGKSEEEWVQEVRGWQDLGAGYMGINTMRAGFTSLQQHLDALRRFKDLLTDSGLWSQ